MSQSSENYNNQNSSQNTIYVAARALDLLNLKLKDIKIEIKKKNIELLSNEIVEIEECCQTLGKYINAVDRNYELYEDVFCPPNPPTTIER